MKFMKDFKNYLYICIFVYSFICILPPSAFAASITPGARLTQTAVNRSAALQKIINTGDQMITIRISSLNSLLSRIQGDKRLTSSEQINLTNNITSMITNLQTLKAKFDADTDVMTARTDVMNIINFYHVFVTFEPQIRLTIITDNLLIMVMNIQNLIIKLQNLSAKLKSQGKDTSKIDPAISDMSSQIGSIINTLISDQKTLNNVVLTNNNYQATFQSIRQDFIKIQASFAQIRTDIATIKANVKGSFGNSPKSIPTGITLPTITISPVSSVTSTPSGQ